jgi:hypothetical protein
MLDSGNCPYIATKETYNFCMAHFYAPKVENYMANFEVM